jgi:polyribonucleotide nucleotidyltransferase
MFVEKSIDLGGRKLTLQVGKVAKQAQGSVWVRFEDTVILATVCAQKEARPGQDFFPLSVEYREKQYAAGRIPGGFFKREARPGENEILNSRLIDRPLRPLFDDGFMAETQVICNVVSYDKSCEPGPLACCGSSLALIMSPIPFRRPVASVMVARVNGEAVVCPSLEQLEMADVEMVVAATEESITMVEGEAAEISEQEMLELVRFAHTHIRAIIALQNDIIAELGAVTKWEVKQPDINTELKARLEAAVAGDMPAICKISEKSDRNDANAILKEKVLATFEGDDDLLAEAKELIGDVLHDSMKVVMREAIVNEGVRLDGRGTTEIRPIACEINVLPRAHGSALFTRGQTQSLSALTLGTGQDQQRVDGIFGEHKRKFMLHYNFPPFSVGEVRRMFSTSRREIGHGNLAERALKGQLDADYPYTVRMVSEILESNGSSSMATVCASSMAMMSGGVPLKKPVAGIAMGLVKEGQGVAILSDILGDEDHLGDMDFKVCGTQEGITAFQMDIKIDGLSYEIMETALNQARTGRIHILGKMAEAITAPSNDMSKYAPRLETVMVPVDKIGMIIGPGGKMIREIQESTGSKIDIADDGAVTIACDDGESLQRATQWIRDMIAEPEIGATYTGKVVTIVDFGAFLEIMPGREGLLHISEIEWGRVERVEDVLKIGDKVDVLLQSMERGKYSLSRRALLEKPAGYVEQPKRERGPGGPRGGGRGGRDGGRDGGGRGGRDGGRGERR